MPTAPPWIHHTLADTTGPTSPTPAPRAPGAMSGGGRSVCLPVRTEAIGASPAPITAVEWTEGAT